MTALVLPFRATLLRAQAADAAPTSAAPQLGTQLDAESAARLRRLARALARTPADADDLAQDAAARLLEKAPHKIGHAGYERRVLTRLWLDRNRSLARRMARLARAAWQKPTVDTATTADPTHALVRGAMDTLPPRQRAVLTLIVVEGLTHAEAAASLGCSEDASRQALAAARRSMRKALEGRVS
jgi:RNA polymerase sigma factor (sigma-70 family)